MTNETPSGHSTRCRENRRVDADLDRRVEDDDPVIVGLPHFSGTREELALPLGALHLSRHIVDAEHDVLGGHGQGLAVRVQQRHAPVEVRQGQDALAIGQVAGPAEALVPEPEELAREVEALHAVVLAAAGLKRLSITPDHVIDLPVDRFVPSPAQGALAIQTREDDPAKAIVAVLDHAETRRGVDAERTFLTIIEAGCQTPLGALAVLHDDGQIELHAQLFSDDRSQLAEGTERGDDPVAVGRALAERLRF